MAAEEANINTPVAPQAPLAQPEAKPAVEKAKPVVEKQANCLGCGKPIKKIKRYYRDGKFYCNKKCWRKSITKKEAK